GGHARELPFELRGAPVVWNDDDDPTDLGGFVIHARDDGAVAFAACHATPSRWCYLGKVAGHPTLRRAALLVGHGRDWPELWKEGAAGGARVLVDEWRRAVCLDGAGRE